jgi:MYXO-CTERM domain-containing protein
VSTAGKVLDPMGIDLGETSSGATVAVGHNGTHYLAAWSTPCGDADGCGTMGWHVQGKRISSTGDVADAEPLVLGTIQGAIAQTQVQVASHAGSWMVVWAPYGRQELFALPVAADGSHGDAPVRLPEGQFSSLATDGSGYLVAYASQGKILVTRLGEGGAATDAPGVVVGDTGYPNAIARTSVAFDGTDYLVGWTTFANTSYPLTLARRVSSAGAPVGESISFGETPRSNDSAAGLSCIDGTCLVTLRARSRALAIRRIDRSGPLPGAAILAFGPNTQTAPSVATNGSGYLVAWRDDRLEPGSAGPARNRIFGGRVDAAGALASEVMRLSGDADVSAGAPQVASDGSTYAVLYGEGERSDDCFAKLKLRRLSAEGALLDEGPVVVGDTDVINGCLDAPRLVFDGTNFVATWIDIWSTGHGDIYARRITPAGEILEAKQNRRGGLTGEVQLVKGNASTFVVWGKCRAVGGNPCRDGDLVASRLLDGAFSDPAGALVLEGASDFGGRFSATYAKDAYLVVSESANSGGAVKAARVAESGEVGAEPLAVGSLPEAAKVHDGKSLLEIGSDTGELVAIQLRPSGGALAESRVPLTPMGKSRIIKRYATATDRAGHTLVAYQTYAKHDGTTASQLATRILTSTEVDDLPPPPPPPPDGGPDVRPTPPDSGPDVRPPPPPPPPPPPEDAGPDRDSGSTRPPPPDNGGSSSGSSSGTGEITIRVDAGMKKPGPKPEADCSVAAPGAASSSGAASPLAVLALLGALRRRRNRHDENKRSGR